MVGKIQFQDWQNLFKHFYFLRNYLLTGEELASKIIQFVQVEVQKTLLKKQ